LSKESDPLPKMADKSPTTDLPPASPAEPWRPQVNPWLIAVVVAMAAFMEVLDTSIANVAPRLSLRLHELASAGHSAELDKLMKELVIPLYALRARRKGYEVSVMKAMMDMIGLAGGPVRPPLVDVTAEDMNTPSKMIERWREWVSQPTES